MRSLHISHPALLDLCKTFTILRYLDLGGVLLDSRDDDVLRTISACMPQLEWLDIAHSRVSLSAIRCLLPTEDVPGRGCPELEVLSLWGIKHIDVKFLKSIIIGLPKLKALVHLLMINVLVELTDEEASLGSFKCLTQFRLHCRAYPDVNCDGIHLRYDILRKAPHFASTCNIAEVEISLEYHLTISLTDLLMPLAKLDSITLHGLSNGHKGLLTVLESKGHQLRSLHLFNVFETVSLLNITRTAHSLKSFTMICDAGSSLSSGSMNVNKDQGQQSGSLAGLFHLDTISLGNLSQKLCTREMLSALLVSPYLKTVSLTSVESLDDGVLAGVLSCSPWGLPTLTSVEYFYLKDCPNIIAPPFVRLLGMKGTMLKVLHIKDCDMVDGDVVRAAVEMYPRPLEVIIGPSSPE